MRPSVTGSILVTAAVLGLAACGPDGSVATDLTGPSFEVVSDPGHTLHMGVCKIGLDEATIGQPFSFTTEATDGDVWEPAFSLTAQDVTSMDPVFDCKIVWGGPDRSYDSDTQVTVTELVPDGYTLESVEVRKGDIVTPLDPVDGSVTVVPESGGKWIYFYNRATPPAVPGRMTGGGHQIRVDGSKITRGLTLHCDITLSNNLEINWPGGNNWHLQKESLESVQCIDDPAYDPFPPDAPFDTFIARALGSLNGVENSIIDFKFIDNGEPGDTDEAHFTIYAPNQGPGQVAPGSEVSVLTVGGQLDGGNLQAHYDQPHS